LARLTAYPEMSALYLAGAPVTDAGLEQLQALPQLRWLNVTGTQVTPAGIAALQQAIPDLAVIQK